MVVYLPFLLPQISKNSEFSQIWLDCLWAVLWNEKKGMTYINLRLFWDSCKSQKIVSHEHCLSLDYTQCFQLHCGLCQMKYLNWQKPENGHFKSSHFWAISNLHRMTGKKMIPIMKTKLGHLQRPWYISWFTRLQVFSFSPPLSIGTCHPTSHFSISCSD